MANELTGLQLLVTRPIVQAQQWVPQLTALGIVPTCVPVLEIVPLTDEESVQTIKNSLYDLDLYNKVIFVSQNAVQHGMDWVDDLWPQYPIEQQYYAIGAATAAALIERGVHACAGDNAMNSEALLALPELQAVAGQRILIMRGKGGRTTLGDELAARGARVDYLALYERRMPQDTFADLQQWLAKAATPKLISVHSGESLDNLNHMVETAPELAPLKNIPVVVPGQRVAEQAKANHWPVVKAENATHPAMVAAMSNWLQSAP